LPRRPERIAQQPTLGLEVKSRREDAMPSDQEFLLYPLDTGEDPACLDCGALMMLAGHEVRESKPDFITFRCQSCGRTEKYVCDE
jgi:hypothetical protein